nr:hypothetical protein [Tanacetum cinerariifolium]
MGYEKPSTKLTFYKAFFSTQWKFFIHTILHSLSAKRTSWNEFKHAEEEVATNVVPPTPTLPLPLSPIIPSSPPHQSPCPPQPQDAEGSSHVFQQVLDTCSALVLRVEGLETANATQQLEIVKLKASVKKLEMLNKVKSSKLRCLKKVGTSQRVESSDDVENVFNQGRISVDMETGEGVKLVVDQEKNAKVEGRHADKQAKIYNIDLDHSLKVLSMQEDDTEVQEAVEVVTTAKLITKVVTAAATQVVAASTPIPTAKPKILKIAAALAVSTRRRKGVRYHGFKKKPQSESEARKNMISYLKNTEGYKMEFFKGKTYDQILPIFQARKLSEEAQEADDLKKKLEIVQDEDDDVFVKDTLLAQKVLVVDYQVVVIDKKPKYKIIRAYDTHQFYISFINLLKNFDKEDLETLWRIVKDRFYTSKLTNFLDEYLLLTLKTMFGELDEQDAIWRNQKSVHGLALVKRWKLLTLCGMHVIILLTV